MQLWMQRSSQEWCCRFFNVFREKHSRILQQTSVHYQLNKLGYVKSSPARCFVVNRTLLLQSQVISGILLWSAFVGFVGFPSAFLNVRSNKSRAAQPGNSSNGVVQAIFEALMAIVWIV